MTDHTPLALFLTALFVALCLGATAEEERQ
jgi:hypothetical protein